MSQSKNESMFDNLSVASLALRLQAEVKAAMDRKADYLKEFQSEKEDAS